MELHLAEAARLMGYEVVEDQEESTMGQVNQMEQSTRPRICEVLGVDISEPFKVKGYSGEYHINDDGVLKWGGQTSDDAIYAIINHPDRIIRKPRFTEVEVARAKNLLDVVGGGTISKPGTGGTFLIADRKTISLRDDVFPPSVPANLSSSTASSGRADIVRITLVINYKICGE